MQPNLLDANEAHPIIDHQDLAIRHLRILHHDYMSCATHRAEDMDRLGQEARDVRVVCTREPAGALGHHFSVLLEVVFYVNEYFVEALDELGGREEEHVAPGT